MSPAEISSQQTLDDEADIAEYEMLMQTMDQSISRMNETLESMIGKGQKALGNIESMTEGVKGKVLKMNEDDTMNETEANTTPEAD